MIVPGSPEVTYFYHQDALGSVVALSKFDSGSVSFVEKYSYSAFGETTVTQGGTSGNPYRFTGREYEPETGLYYYRARFYNPAIGRFLQTDPIGYADSMNLYQYCGNNPINFVDPMGLRAWSGLFRPNAAVTIRTQSNVTQNYRINEASDFVNILKEYSKANDKIANLEYYGHGDASGEALNVEFKINEKSYEVIRQTGIMSNNDNNFWKTDNVNRYEINSIKQLIQNAFVSNASITLNACYSAHGEKSIAKAFQQILPNADVYGWTGLINVDPFYKVAYPEKGTAYVKVNFRTF